MNATICGFWIRSGVLFLTVQVFNPEIYPVFFFKSTYVFIICRVVQEKVLTQCNLTIQFMKYSCFFKVSCLNWYSSHFGRNDEQLLSSHLLCSICDLSSVLYLFSKMKSLGIFFSDSFPVTAFFFFFWAPLYALGAEETRSYTQYSRHKHSPNNGLFPYNSCLWFVLLC